MSICFNILTCSNFGNLHISEELIYVLNKFREWTPGLRGWSPQNQSKTGYCHRLSPKSADCVIIMLSTKMKMKYVSGADPEMCWWRLCLWTTATAVSRSTNQPTNQPTIQPSNHLYLNWLVYTGHTQISDNPVWSWLNILKPPPRLDLGHSSSGRLR